MTRRWRVLIVSLVCICPPFGATPLVHAWSQRFGDTSSQIGQSVAVDASGNMIVTGYVDGDVDFGGGELSGSGHVFIAKFDASGNHVWSDRFGDASSGWALGVAVDGSGNVIITGYFEGSINFGGGTLTSAGDDDIFLAKFDASGNHLWSQRFGNVSFGQVGNSVAFDASGNVIVTGYFWGAVNFGGGTLTSAGNDDIFVAKFDEDGNHLWSKRVGNANVGQVGNSVAVDVSGNVFVTGSFFGAVNFGGGNLTSAGLDDIFLAKFNSSGTHLWSRRFGDSDTQWSQSVAVDATGNVFVTGHFYGTVNFGGGNITSAGDADIFLAKLSPSSFHLWSKRFGDASSPQFAMSAAVDNSGNVTMAGYYYGSVAFGGDFYSSIGGTEVFVATLTGTGDHIRSAHFGDVNNQTANGAAVDGSGNVIVTGHFVGTVNFGDGPLTSEGDLEDIFVARLSANPVTAVPADGVPSSDYAMQNAPNPFNPNTRITFGLREAGEVSLRIYDASGRLVRVLMEGPHTAGPHTIEWNGDDNAHRPVASGVYFCRLDAAGETRSRKLVLLK